MTEQRVKGSYALISLGCPKNLVDSERMAGLLRLDGYVLVPEPEGADFVVINTCGFIGDARSESHAVIREMLALKRRRRIRGVIVTGCLARRTRKSCSRPTRKSTSLWASSGGTRSPRRSIGCRRC